MSSVTFAIFVLLATAASVDCQLNCLTQADITIILDGSTSVGAANFELIKQFTVDLINGFSASISERWVQMSLITYSLIPKDEFYFNDTHDPAVMRDMVNNLTLNNGSTHTYKALFNVYNIHFGAAKGRRTEVPGIVLLLTDGVSTNQPATSHNANILKSTVYNATIFAIGIENASLSEINDLSSDPDSKYSYFVNTFSDLSSIVNTVIEEACTSVPISAVVSGNLSSSNLTQLLAQALSGTPQTAKSGLSEGQKVGLAVGVPAAMVLVVGGAVLGVCCAKGALPARKKKSKEKEEELQTGDIGQRAAAHQAERRVPPANVKL